MLFLLPLLSILSTERANISGELRANLNVISTEHWSRPTPVYPSPVAMVSHKVLLSLYSFNFGTIHCVRVVFFYAKGELFACPKKRKKGFTVRASASAYTWQRILNLNATTGVITEPEIDSPHWVRGTHFVPASLQGSWCWRRRD